MDSSSDEEDKKIDDFFGKEHFDGKSGEKVRMLGTTELSRMIVTP